MKKNQYLCSLSNSKYSILYRGWRTWSTSSSKIAHNSVGQHHNWEQQNPKERYIYNQSVVIALLYYIDSSYGNCEEQLTSTDCRPTVGQQITDRLPTDYRQVTNRLLTGYQQVTNRLLTGYQQVTDSWQPEN